MRLRKSRKSRGCLARSRRPPGRVSRDATGASHSATSCSLRAPRVFVDAPCGRRARRCRLRARPAVRRVVEMTKRDRVDASPDGARNRSLRCRSADDPAVDDAEPAVERSAPGNPSPRVRLRATHAAVAAFELAAPRARRPCADRRSAVSASIHALRPPRANAALELGELRLTQRHARRHRVTAEASSRPGCRVAIASSTSRTCTPGTERAEPLTQPGSPGANAIDRAMHALLDRATATRPITPWCQPASNSAEPGGQLARRARRRARRPARAPRAASAPRARGGRC